MKFWTFIRRVFVRQYCTVFGCVDGSECLTFTAHGFRPCSRCLRDVYSGQTIAEFIQEQRDLPPVDVDDMDFDCWEDR